MLENTYGCLSLFLTRNTYLRFVFECVCYIKIRPIKNMLVARQVRGGSLCGGGGGIR